MKKKITPWMVFGILWLLVVVISWNAFPTWKKMEGGIWILIATAAIGVIAFLKDSVEYIKAWFETPSSPETKPTASQPVPNPPETDVQRVSEPAYSPPLASQPIPAQPVV